MPQNSWDHCDSFAHFQKSSQESCECIDSPCWTLSCAKLMMAAILCPLSLLIVHKQHSWTAEATSFFLCKSCYSGILFVKSWRQEKQMSSTSTRGYQTADLKNLWLDILQLMLDQCQQKQQLAVLCPACAEWRQIYWRNCNSPREKYWWTPLSYFGLRTW